MGSPRPAWPGAICLCHSLWCVATIILQCVIKNFDPKEGNLLPKILCATARFDNAPAGQITFALPRGHLWCVAWRTGCGSESLRRLLQLFQQHLDLSQLALDTLQLLAKSGHLRAALHVH